MRYCGRLSVGFRHLNLQEEYRSDKDSIIDDFLIRCLEVSKFYDRAVGYFTSEGLSLAARGIVEFIRGGGKKIRLVISPVLSAEDAEDMKSGYERRLEVITRRVVDVLESEMDDLEAGRLSMLAWLVSHGYLDIKLAIRESVDSHWQGIYHEKIGIFYDHSGNKIAFTGSANETRGGLLSNFECIDTYTSWELPSRVERKITAFHDLWDNRTYGLTIIPFPEAARKKLIELAATELPDCDPESKRAVLDKQRLELRYYQRDAIEFWQQNNYKAIFAMATGSGKTFTALKAVESLIWDGYTIIVLVPRNLLLKQWVDEIESFYGSASILECSGTTNWRRDLPAFLILGSRRAKNGFRTEPLFIVSTVHTGSSEDFLSMVRAYSERMKLVLIVDETHWLGAPELSKAMDLPIEKRLGLSATPERGWDEEGTQKILEFYGNNEYEYGLAKAIKEGYLTPYDYMVKEVELTPKEYRDYVELTKKIAQSFSLAERDEKQQKKLDSLIFRRASIVKASDNKRGFVSWVHETFKPEMCLVYCENIEHLRAVKKDLSAVGKFVVEYHSELSEAEKEASLNALKRGTAQYLVSIRCLDEGVDIPECREAIILSSSQNKRVFIQRRGRVLRKSPGKNHARIFDPIVVPSVSGTESSGELDGLTLKELERAKEFAESARPLSRIQVLDTISRIKERFSL